MSDATDASLVNAALAGDTERFCALVRRYQDHVYGVAVGVLADVHLARDAAQEAFLCAYCDLPKLRDARRFGAWMCGIARNTAMEVRRDRQRQIALATRAAQRAPSGTVRSAEDLAIADEQAAVVQEALRRVRDKDREALTLYYADGLSYAEVCGFLGISLGTLKGRLQRGRAALRKELAMVEQACKDNAPDEAFARELERAIRVFGAKGPATHHLPSDWHESLRAETKRLLAAGDAGARVDLALSHAGSRRQRRLAASRLGIRRDAQSLRTLERLLEDRAPRVRREAAVWYAAAIHPLNATTWVGPPQANAAAASVPQGLDRLLARMTDESFNVRMAALQKVAAYREAGDRCVAWALQAALDDPKHKVRHAAARVLGVPCPGCGRTR